jgi:hypothetical protein
MLPLLCAAALKVRFNQENIIPGTNIEIDDCFTRFFQANRRPWPLNEQELLQIFRVSSGGIYAIQDLPSLDDPYTPYMLPTIDVLVTIIHNIASSAPHFQRWEQDEELLFIYGGVYPQVLRDFAQRDAKTNIWYPSYTLSNLYSNPNTDCAQTPPLNKTNLWKAANMREIEQVRNRFKFGALEHDSPAIPLLIQAVGVEAYFLD